MVINSLQARIKTAVRGAAVLLFGVGAVSAQQQINLTAAPAIAPLPDGSSVPMWGYGCGAVTGGTATCAPLNPTATAGQWSPVVITVPTGQGLTINLTNNLPTPPGATAGIPTSLMIVGQIGGGLGSDRATTTSPNHSGQGVTWPIANTGDTFTPPTQPDRVRSFGTEVAAGATTQLTWSSLRPGTYLIESGTHPSIQATMGLYGILVVTAAPASTGATGTAYPGVTYSSEVPLLFGEIDPVQNSGVSTAVNTAGFSETKVWSGQTGQCGDPNAGAGITNTCYPPVVNYTPLYYTINGVAFSKSNASASLFPSSVGTSTTPVSGNVLVRFVNAGSHMHVPSIVGSTTGTAKTSGFQLVAEDGNPVPGAPRVQSEVFMAAGKTYDVMINVPPAGGTALPVYDRELSLSANKINRDAGMLAYIGVNGATVPAASGVGVAPTANPDTYNSVIAGHTVTVSDPSKGVIANDVNIFGVAVLTPPTKGTLTLNTDGTFTYVANSTWATSDSFVYCGNGATSGAACATVTLGAATIELASGITVPNSSFTSTMATFIKIPNPGVLTGAVDAAGYPLTVVGSSVMPASGLTVVADPAGGFIASVASPGTYSFTFLAQNAQGTQTASPATATITFPTGSGLAVNLVDGKTGAKLSDYRWIIEEDRSFYIDPNCTTNIGTPSSTNPIPSGCTASQLPGGTVPLLGTNFHTSNMPFVAQGCTGPLSCESGQTMLGQPAVCDMGNGVCRPDTSGNGKTPVDPKYVYLDPTKRYYISVLPGDAANPFIAGNGSADCSNNVQGATGCGHGMGGAPIAPGQTAVTVKVQTDPFPPAQLSVQVFEDDFPLNGEQDAGGGVDVLATNEPGLGGFNIILWDDMGGSGDPTGQMTYDMFNQPLGNSLDGYIDPATGNNACPITKQAAGIVGMIVTCPKYESDGMTLSPLAGQALVSNLMPGRFSVQAIPGADRIAKGEEWLQTNTLDGQKAHDAFLRIGEPGYFQEFGPAGYHVNIGFANPAIINARLGTPAKGKTPGTGICGGVDPNLSASNCTNTVTGHVTTERMSRTPDERLYGSGNRASFSFTQCYVSIGDPDGEDFQFTKCDADGNFKFTGIPDGYWRVTTFDEWNDQLVDGLSFPVGVNSTSANNTCPGSTTKKGTCDMGEVPANQWQANVYTRVFIDEDRTGVYDATKDGGIGLIPVTVRYRDGSRSNNSLTDFGGVANFNEEFPLFNWYVVEADPTRYKTTGIHAVYDAGGPADGTSACGQTTAGYPLCGSTGSTTWPYNNLANTYENVPLPSNLSVPGAVYCATADCAGMSISNGATPSKTTTHSTGRIDPPWVPAEGWQGYSGENNFIEFGKAPYAPGENGGISGHVIYKSTRPFDDPQMGVQLQWEPGVPHVTVNLYQEGLAADGVTKTLKLVDTTQTSSWDDWAQGFRSDGVPNMNCPGQSTSDLFYFSLFNQPNYLDLYNKQHATAGLLNTAAIPTGLPDNSQFKCYDGMHNWNQLQPAPYDGMYSFPSVLGRNPQTGNTTGTNCTICVKNPDAKDTFRYNKENMLPVGKYVVEIVPPPGYEIVKEEDKNILIGDNFIAPAVQEFGGFGDIFILPDQASVAASQQYPGPGYNSNNAQNPTQNLGTVPTTDEVPGFPIGPEWPCVGDARVVPDYISLFPQSQEVAPFAGATRNLCDRKEVTLTDQQGTSAYFGIFTSTHVAAKFTGVITDDFTSEFDPFSPQFGEKFAPPNMPIAIKDWTGTEISRVYSDWWGDYDGMTYSTWEVNPPNPTGYSPTMMIFCMNDKGPIAGPNGTQITDPLYNPAYSQFCYELPYMPGNTDYLDTPVVPTSAFSAGYNHTDCAYPALTPAVSEVDGDGVGPWVSASGNTLTINALGDQTVQNYGYSGPQATTAPFNAKTITRHYGFGGTTGTVTIGGVPATVTSWTDGQIKVTVPATGGTTGVPACAVQQQAQYGGSTAYCGELQITTATGQQSVDTVTVTIGGKAPTYVDPTKGPLTAYGPGAIQQAIDAANPGDLIIVPPGTFQEMVLMWKPVRLQGVGAASSIIDANTQPAGKVDPWRRQLNCLFGLDIKGNPSTGIFDPSGTYSCGSTNSVAWTGFNAIPNYPQIDRLPLEGIVGWDASVNGNLAQILSEPTLMGAYEGAGITVLGKGVNVPAGLSSGYFGSGNEATFPTGTLNLTAKDCTTGPSGTNPYPSNFQCNPSAIDGLSVTDASQGGGGIFDHAWAHNLQIANNRVFGNIGTLSGGINIGQGEFPDAYLNGTTLDTDPGSCLTGAGYPVNTQLPYCFNLNVNVHNNAVTLNTSIGDELFSGTPAGSGGVSFCTGADYYKFNYNWVCGNMSTGDGGGVAHIGFIWNGDIEHNSILFNQSLNPTIPTNGGGLIVMGAPPDGNQSISGGAVVECGSVTDNDCAPGLSDGTGPGLVINANLIMGNAAEAGSGGGLRFQAVNGTDVPRFPTQPSLWYSPMVTNNIITNNVAGWDGGGVSLEDALTVSLINNTIASNDSTATAGVLFNTLGAPLASSQTPGTNQSTSATTSAPQVAGLVSMQNSPQLTTAYTSTPKCPAVNPHCDVYSSPYLANDLFWQNRTYFIGVGSLSAAYQQNIVTLYNSTFSNKGVPTTTGAPLQAQTTTGSCPTGSGYWDIGVRGDPGPGNHSKIGNVTAVLSPTYSLLTNASESSSTTNLTASNPQIASQYCNGSRTPPELQGQSNAGLWNVPPGISDATVPNPIFNLTPSATVDEGNNWINLTWGPLSLTNPVTGTTLGNYGLVSGSPAIDHIPTTAPTYAIAPPTDFFGNKRPDISNTAIDIGAVEFQANIPAPTLTSIAPTSGSRGTSVNVTLTGTNLTGATAITVSGTGVTVSNLTVVSSTSVTATFTITATATLSARTVSITTPGGISNTVTFTVTAPPAPTLTSIAPTSGSRGTSVNVTLTGTNLTGATAITVSGTGVTVSSLTVVSSTSVTATFTITATAALSARTVSITTAGGTSNTVTFTVANPPAPTLASISPIAGTHNTTVPITLTGTNFTATGTTIGVTGNGITVSGITVNAAGTSLTANFAISNGATRSARTVTVTTPGGTSGGVTFTVN